MDKNINDISNKEKIAIVVVGYNRIDSLSRLLQSLSVSKLPNSVPLVISVDCSGNEELYDYVKSFRWQFGDKYVFIQSKRLGLKEHILKCGDLSKYFKAIVLLEDDIYVSPFFYDYIEATVNKYSTDTQICGIGLFKNEINGYAKIPLEFLNDGADVFLWQEVCTWGECWTYSMWSEFREWYDENENFNFEKIDIPQEIKMWKNAWSRYLLAYMIQTEKYFLYPQISLTTNFNDCGVHVNELNNTYQVNMLYGSKQYILPEFAELNKYDIYCANSKLYALLNMSQAELTIDFYNLKEKKNYKRWILTSAILNYKIVKSFGLNLHPYEVNIMVNNSGQGLFLYDTKIRCKNIEKNALYSYFYGNLRLNIIIKGMIGFLRNKFISRIKL